MAQTLTIRIDEDLRAALDNLGTRLFGDSTSAAARACIAVGLLAYERAEQGALRAAHLRDPDAVLRAACYSPAAIPDE